MDLLDVDAPALSGLEDGFYSEGYTEGLNADSSQDHAEAYAYGVETAYERFERVGYVYGLLSVWELFAGRSGDGGRRQRQLERLRAALDALPRDNEPRELESETFAACWARVQARVRACAALWGHTLPSLSDEGGPATELAIEEGPPQLFTR